MSGITERWILGVFTVTNRIDSLGMIWNLPFKGLETSFLVSSLKKINLLTLDISNKKD